jgi:hypothetical protein
MAMYSPSRQIVRRKCSCYDLRSDGVESMDILQSDLPRIPSSGTNAILQSVGRGQCPSVLWKITSK